MVVHHRVARDRVTLVVEHDARDLPVVHGAGERRTVARLAEAASFAERDAGDPDRVLVEELGQDGLGPSWFVLAGEEPSQVSFGPQP